MNVINKVIWKFMFKIHFLKQFLLNHILLISIIIVYIQEIKKICILVFGQSSIVFLVKKEYNTPAPEEQIFSDKEVNHYAEMVSYTDLSDALHQQWWCRKSISPLHRVKEQDSYDRRLHSFGGPAGSALLGLIRHFYISSRKLQHDKAPSSYEPGALVSMQGTAYRWIRPEPSPPASFSTSATVTML